MTSFIDALKAYHEKLAEMSIQEQIVFEMKTAMKMGYTKSRDFLRVVMAEFARKGKELNDEQALAVIKKMHKDATLMENDYEITILERWLPKTLTEEETEYIVEVIILENKLCGLEMMGKAMGLIKQHEKSSQLDMKLASKLAKKILLIEE